jgi:HEAT repeat protein
LKQKRDTAGLIKLLKSRDANSRRAAIQALGEIGAKPSTAALCELLSNAGTDRAEQVDLANALGAIGDPGAVGALLQAVVISRDRERALLADANSAADHTRVGFAVNVISGNEYEVRHAIAQALGKIGGEPALRGLFAMLAAESGPMEDSGKTAARAAIAEMLERNQPAYLQVLFDQSTAESVECRQYAAERLREFRDSTVVDHLIAIACNENEAYIVRQSAIASLGRIGDIRALPCLTELSQSQNRALARDARINAAEVRQRQRPELD